MVYRAGWRGAILDDGGGLPVGSLGDGLAQGAWLAPSPSLRYADRIPIDPEDHTPRRRTAWTITTTRTS